MGSLFRSQPMLFRHLVMPKESAWEILNELGDANCLHFVDPDPTLPLINRPFANYIKRSEEILQKLSMVEAEAKKWGLEIEKCNNYQLMLDNLRQHLKNRQKAPHTYFDEIESFVAERQAWLMEQIKNFENLQEKKNSYVEYRAVLIGAKSILGGQLLDAGQQSGRQGGIQGMVYEEIQHSGVRLNHVVGTIDQEDEFRFEKMIFRVTKGNAWIKFTQPDEQYEIIDPISLKVQKKRILIILYPGGGQETIKNKLARICDSFNVNRFAFPEGQANYQQKLKEVDTSMKESQDLARQTGNVIRDFLKQFVNKKSDTSNCSYVEELRLHMLKEKTIYHSMNMFKVNNSMFQGHCWIPACNETRVNDIFYQLNRSHQNQHYGQISTAIAETLDPPTYFETNEFTWPFQEIVNTYGIPRYREVNPGLFTTITFPFLFGVMFGDMAHGSILLLFGSLLIFGNQKLKNNEFFSVFLPYRFILMLMGFFAFYCGLLYNDFTSLTFNFFGSCYSPDITQKCPESGSQKCYVRTPNCVYPFGIDPIWNKTENEIAFVNSFKMKLAVILGVVQMTLGIILKGFNAINFRKPLDFFFEFVPQLLFMLLTFGYMDYLIFQKWGTNWLPNTGAAPSIITIMINMPLKFGSPDGYNVYPPFTQSQFPDKVDKQPISLSPYNIEERSIQLTFLLIAVICIPLMLLPKPLIMRFKNQRTSSSVSIKRQNQQEGELVGSQELQEGLKEDLQKQLIAKKFGQSSEIRGHQEEDFGEIFIHQVIETIEFVLGSISNTASYLRLWALSLAHSQLAAVFFGMTVQGGLFKGGILGGFQLIFGYYLFALVTFGVLMCMDVMECFLHALRLHWVEFQNKFFKADGYLFQPFSFVGALKKAEELNTQ